MQIVAQEAWDYIENRMGIHHRNFIPGNVYHPTASNLRKSSTMATCDNKAVCKADHESKTSRGDMNVLIAANTIGGFPELGKPFCIPNWQDHEV